MDGKQSYAIWIFLFVVMDTLGGKNFAEASACAGSPEMLKVDYTSQNIYSPGYPSYYANNQTCDWVFEASPTRKSGIGIQLATLDIELDPSYAVKTPGECDDHLEAFEGTPSNLGRSLGQWCGSTNQMIKSLSNFVTLRFRSNAHYSGKGFVVEYALIRVASAECLPGRITPVHVGRATLYESFDIKNTVNRCTWRFEAKDDVGVSDVNLAIVIEAFKIPSIPCHFGKFIIHDGQDTNTPQVLEWCDSSRPFSTIYLSSKFATMTFAFEEGEELEADIGTIQLKIYTRDLLYECENDSLPSIHAGTDPVYFPLPFVKAFSGSVCDVHVSERDLDHLRVEVRKVNDQDPTCVTDVISVKSAQTNVNAEKLCDRRQYPMYLPSRKDVIISLKNSASKVFLRAVTARGTCGGEILINQASNDLITDIKLPKILDDQIKSKPSDAAFQPPPNCYMRYLIAADKDDRAISLHLTWNHDATEGKVFSYKDACDGDFINVYDGNSDSAPLLFSSCAGENMHVKQVNTRIIGKSNEMLVLFNTDGSDEARSPSLEFFSVPESDFCKDTVEIWVNHTEQNLTSPNYPDFFPIDYTCTYKLTAADEGDVIVIEILDSSFTMGCGDVINIYEGKRLSVTEGFIGRICGHDKKQTFVSACHEAVIRFSSDKFGSVGGWKLRLYSQPKDSSFGCRNYGTLWLLVLMLTIEFVLRK